MNRGWILAASAAVFYSTLGNAHTGSFSPSHQLSGIGIARSEMTPLVLAGRTERMIESQTFAIMREPLALAGAQRITSKYLQRIFEKASHETGIPASLISAMAYLESWGDAHAESPAGPKGIMQFSEATARANGLRVVYSTRYKVTREKQLVKRSTSGKPVYKTVALRTAYSVKVRDDRFLPERAIFAASRYLARLQDKFGGRDWAIFAFHCGEGCVSELLSLTQERLHKNNPTVPEMFFASDPADGRELYEALQRHMLRDYSPTYWFRVKRAEELLDLYRTDPDQFKKLLAEYRNPVDPAHRANDRLMVWLKASEVRLQGDDAPVAQSNELVSVFDDSQFFGFSAARLSGEDPGSAGIGSLNRQASPAAIGTLAYIAFETRRLFAALKPNHDEFVPLEVAELFTAQDPPGEVGRHEFAAHGTGHVFDLDLSNLPASERECLSFILDELGWDGFLGFIQVTGDTVHIGCSPSSREFFSQVYQDAVEAYQ